MPNHSAQPAHNNSASYHHITPNEQHFIEALRLMLAGEVTHPANIPIYVEGRLGLVAQQFYSILQEQGKVVFW